jgi:hypothetical protein
MFDVLFLKNRCHQYVVNVVSEGDVIIMFLTSTAYFGGNAPTTYPNFMLSAVTPALAKLPSTIANQSSGSDEMESGILTATRAIVAPSRRDHQFVGFQ